MKLNRSIHASILVVMLAGCASTITPDGMKAAIKDFDLPVLPQIGEAVVYIVRPSNDFKRDSFKVYLDDKHRESEIGYTKGLQYIYFNIEPGRHTILSKAENWAEKVINVQAGDIIYIQQVPERGITMARNTLYAPFDYQGKYYVKMLKLGMIIRKDVN
jgi:hypothetical protein